MAAVGGSRSEPASADLVPPSWNLGRAQGLGKNEDILMDEEEGKMPD